MGVSKRTKKYKVTTNSKDNLSFVDNIKNLCVFIRLRIVFNANIKKSYGNQILLKIVGGTNYIMDNKYKVSNNMQISRIVFERWICPIICVAAISAFPTSFMYFQNADEVRFNEILNPLLIFTFIGLVLLGFFLIISKDTNKSAIITTVFMLVILNYALMENGMRYLFPALRYWHVLPLFIFILAHIAWFICKSMTNEFANTVTKVLCLVICGLIILNLTIAIPTIIKSISIDRENMNRNNIEAGTPTKNSYMPNIYFIIMDEYSSIDFMKKHYNYDNSSFAQKLKDLGFNLSYTSYNESIMTTTVTTNLVNLGYVVTNLTPESERADMRVANELFGLLTKKGYSITGIANSGYYGLDNAAIDISNSESTTIDGKTISDILYSRTLIWPFYSVTYTNMEKEILSSFKYLKSPVNFSNGANFTMCHLECPHEPFYFDEHGNVYKSPASNWKDKKYYLGQYIFTTDQITEAVNSIVINDPQSIIILQSDHGARASSDPDLFMEVFPLRDITNIFNAIYYKGEKINIEGLSGVNTIRYVLNKAFGEDFPMLEVPPDTYKYK